MLRRDMLIAATGLAATAGPVLAKGGLSTSDEILFGHSGALSGAMETSALVDGARLAFEQSAKQGGVYGRRVRIIAMDDGLSPARTMVNYEELLGQNNVLAMFSCVGSDTTIAASKILERHGASLIGGYAVSDAAREQVRSNAFFVRTTVEREAQAVIDHLVTIGIGDIAVVHMANPGGAEALKHIRAGLASHKLEPSIVISLSAGQDAVKKTAMAVATRKPKAIVMYLGGTLPGELIRATKEMGARPQLYGLSITSGELAARVAGEDARGLSICEVVPYPWSESDSVARDFRRLADAAGVRVSYFSFEGYLNALVALEALKKAGPNPTRASLHVSLRNMRVRISGLDINFAGGRHTGSSFTEMVQVTANGRFVR